MKMLPKDNTRTYLCLDHMISLTSYVLKIVINFDILFGFDSFQVDIHHNVGSSTSNTSAVGKGNKKNDRGGKSSYLKG